MRFMKRIPESKQNLELDDTLAKIVKELSSSVVGQFEICMGVSV